MKNECTNELNTFLEGKSLEFKEIIQGINDIIISADDRLNASIKWKRLTFALNGDFHHWICAINVTKRNIGLIFHFGGLLNDEANLLIKDSSKFLRKIEIDSLSKIDEKVIVGFINQAIDKLPYFIENWREINKEK